MSYIFSWLISFLLALIALPIKESIIFGLIMIVVTQFAIGFLLIPFGLILGLFEKDIGKRGNIINKSFMPLQFVTFLYVVYKYYSYLPLLTIAVCGSYIYWYFTYKHHEKAHKRTFLGH